MPVSNKMAAAGALTADISPVFKAIRNATDVAQAVVNAAWNEITYGDNRTWPDFDSPEGMQWITQDEDGFVVSNTFDAAHWIELRITHYADPIDLLYVRGDDDV